MRPLVLSALAVAALVSPCGAQSADRAEAVRELATLEAPLSLPDGAGVERALEVQAAGSLASPAEQLSAYATRIAGAEKVLAEAGPLPEPLADSRDLAAHLAGRRLSALEQARAVAAVLDPVFAAYRTFVEHGEDSDAALQSVPALAASAAAAWKEAARDLPPEVARLFAQRVKDAASSIWATTPKRLAARKALAGLAQTMAAPPAARPDSEGLDRASYAWRVRYSLGLDQTPEQISLLGQAEAARIKARMTSLAQELYPGLTLAQAMARLQADHPADDQAVVEAYASASERALRFNEEHRLFHVEPGYRVEVQGSQIEKGEQPPAAALHQGARGVPGAVRVTLSHDDPQWLAAHNNARIAPIAVHEGFPGHDYQYLNFDPDSKIFAASRISGLPSRPAVEGYAFYVEKLFAEKGFFTPKEQLAQLSMELFRAFRLVVDSGLHTGRLSREQAVRTLTDEVFLTRAEAEVEVARYLRWPGQALTYFTGYWQIAAIKEAAKAALGPLFDEADFHAAFLSFGPVPLPVIAQRIVEKMRALPASGQAAS